MRLEQLVLGGVVSSMLIIYFVPYIILCLLLKVNKKEKMTKYFLKSKSRGGKNERRAELARRVYFVIKF